jgi:hypothetical protein
MISDWRPCWIIGIITAVSLFSTVSTLCLQRLFGKSIPLIVTGPVVAIVTVLLFIRIGWGSQPHEK